MNNRILCLTIHENLNLRAPNVVSKNSKSKIFSLTIELFNYKFLFLHIKVSLSFLKCGSTSEFLFL